MIRLVCTDVDGTFVGADGRIAERVWPAVDRARAAGIILALCSGRPAFGITRSYADRLHRGAWHVFQNGASVMNLATHESRSTPIAPAAIEALKEQAAETGAVLELYTERDYAVESEGEVARQHAELLGVPFRPRPFASLEGPIVRGQWIVPHERVDEFVRTRPEGIAVGASTSPAMPRQAFLNLTPSGIDKAHAVGVLADLYGIALGDVMFVGDGANDVEAMRIVGSPVAVANAAPEVRAVARLHVADVDAGGLADALALAIAIG